MSALGHKRTYAVQKGMSALPPIATAKADSRKRSCLLYTQKRTCAVQKPMSALGQKPDIRPITVAQNMRRRAAMHTTRRRLKPVGHWTDFQLKTSEISRHWP
jgi:hypothetical protein